MAKAQTDLAKQYHHVGELMQNAHRNYRASEENYKHALDLWREFELPQMQFFEEPIVFDPCDAIRSRMGLGILYCQWARYDDALAVLEEGLIRVENVGEFTMDLCMYRTMLADILACKGRVYMRQHSNNNSLQTALHLLEKSLETNRFLTSVSLLMMMMFLLVSKHWNVYILDKVVSHANL